MIGRSPRRRIRRSGLFTGLTLRGRSLVAAGIAAGACAFLLGQRDLMRVAVLLVALPVVAAAAVLRTRYRLTCTRRLQPPRIAVGERTEAVLRLENVSRLPTGVLLVEDTLPYTLGARPRFVLDRVLPQRAVEVSYRFAAELRGRYQVGPLVVRLTDPFGLAEVTRAFAASDVLVVTPTVTTLPEIRLAGEWGGRGESRTRSVAAAGEDDVAPRQYRHGDDLRRVHWRSTARYGELMVRREEQPWQSRAALLLDARAAAHRGDGPASSLEWAVSAAASIGVHLLRMGYIVRLVTEDGAEISGVPNTDDTFEGVLLDTLAVTKASRTDSLAPAVATLRHGEGESMLVAVLGRLDVEQAEELARLRQHGGATGIAVLLDTTTWSLVAPSQRQKAAKLYEDAANVLRTAGWRVLPAGNDTHLVDLWPKAAAGGIAAAHAELAAERAAATVEAR